VYIVIGKISDQRERYRWQQGIMQMEWDMTSQQLGKHVPAAMNTNATIGVFYVVRAEML
jgi:hypothetical protein